ncbi:hypothetical protein [Salininema proteolyticum]|uniref:Uncharacterized protein n=1 Tax=Salininema proteolyticum TaxID=1607685 RepID=A0ABV8TWV7_9ACTN
MSNEKLPKTVPGGKNHIVQPGHLEIGEITSPHIGASSPFGESTPIPMPVSEIDWEHSPKIPERIEHEDE